MDSRDKQELLVMFVAAISTRTGIESTPRAVVRQAKELVQELELVVKNMDATE